MTLTDLSTIRSLSEKYSFRFRKDYGQNFLINAGVPQHIAEICGAGEEDGILEIGTGIGTLTVCLADVAGRVLSLEIDRTLEPLHSETLMGHDNIDVVFADCMKADLAELCETYLGGRELHVCANLPYYITTPVIMRLLECGVPFKSITVMIQREVADRLCADAGDSEYGAVTAAVSYYAEAQKCFNVSAGSFYPAPKVDSTVIRLTLYKEPPVGVPDRALLFSVIHAAFEQRRKTLVNALTARFGGDFSKEELAEAIEEAGISAGIRGERLNIVQFAAISTAIYNRRRRKI